MQFVFNWSGSGLSVSNWDRDWTTLLYPCYTLAGDVTATIANRFANRIVIAPLLGQCNNFPICPSTLVGARNIHQFALNRNRTKTTTIMTNHQIQNEKRANLLSKPKSSQLSKGEIGSKNGYNTFTVHWTWTVLWIHLCLNPPRWKRNSALSLASFHLSHRPLQ